MPADSGENTAFDNSFTLGADVAASAEQTAREIHEDTPGAEDGAWDDDDESVSGSVSGFMRNVESQRDPFIFRQIPHEFLHLNGNGFLIPFYQSFQTAAAEQLEVSKAPTSTIDMASSSVTEASRNLNVEIEEKDQPKIGEQTESLLKSAYYQDDGALLVASGFEGQARDVALDPSHDRAYVVTHSGNLYGVTLPGGTKRKLVTSGSLGSPRGVAVDGNGNAYVTDSGGRVLRVNLSNGDTETIVTGVTPYGIALDGRGKAYLTDQTDAREGKLIEVRLEEGNEKVVIVDGLGPTTSGVALDGKGKAYTGHHDSHGILWEIDLVNRTKTAVTTLARVSCDIALDGEGTAYISDHANDCLYKLRLDGGVPAVAVKPRGHFSPFGVALDSDNGVVYVSTYEGQLWRFSLRVLQSPELIEMTTGV